MSKQPSYEQWYVVIRVDERESGSAHVEEFELNGEMVPAPGPANITIKEVVQTSDEARQEVIRLNNLNAGKRCKYYWQATHVFLNGGSHGKSQE